MTTSLRRLLLVTTLAVALLAPAAAEAKADLPVGEAKGVRLVVERGGLILIFSRESAGLRERIASRYAWMSCTSFDDEVFSSSFGGNLDVPRRGRRVRTGFGGGDRVDYCRFYLRAHTVKRRGGLRVHVPRRALFSIPLTQAGAVYLDEDSKAYWLYIIELLARLTKHDLKLSGYPSYAQISEINPRIAGTLVELAGPGDSPPSGRYGYYSDGHEQIAVAALSASGRRLFIERSAGDVLSTNVAGYLFR